VDSIQETSRTEMVTGLSVGDFIDMSNISVNKTVETITGHSLDIKILTAVIGFAVGVLVVGFFVGFLVGDVV
jgi:hypothetical protein